MAIRLAGLCAGHAERAARARDRRLDAPARRTYAPRFVTLYFDEVDTAGHHFGPGAPETAAAVGNVDKVIGALRASLAGLGQRSIS
ncbi:MAG: alkaline phosphatase family protein [Sphingomonas sp.]